MDERRAKQLDVVIPCHNEEEVVEKSYHTLTSILKSLIEKRFIESYQLIFVDNGSTDNTLAVLLNLHKKDLNITVVALRNNFGFQGSLSAGLYHSEGDAVVTIDADLQDPPEKIEEMLLHYNKGFDLVLGVRTDRKSDHFLKRLTAHWYYRILKMMRVPIVPHHGDFRLMSKGLVDVFNQLPERNRFIRAMILKLEKKYAVVEYPRRAREAGSSKFSPFALISFGLDGITSYSYVPLRIATALGLIFSAFSFTGIAFVIYEKLVHNRVLGWASLLTTFLFFSGLQMLFLGIFGEYLGKIYTEIKQRPLFVVRKKYHHATKNLVGYKRTEMKNPKESACDSLSLFECTSPVGD